MRSPVSMVLKCFWCRGTHPAVCTGGEGVHFNHRDVLATIDLRVDVVHFNGSSTFGPGWLIPLA